MTIQALPAPFVEKFDDNFWFLHRNIILLKIDEVIMQLFLDIFFKIST